MRLAVYTDYSYTVTGDGVVLGERAFVLFLGRLGRFVDHLVVPGRVTRVRQSHYVLDDAIEFIPLPDYPSVTSPLLAARSWLQALVAFWGILGRVDAIWLLGPHPLVLPLWLLARVRGRPVALGVRQSTPAYVRARHPGRRWVHFVADTLDGLNRLLARRCRTVVVGPELAEHYGRSPELLEIAVALVDEEDLVAPEDALRRDYDGELRILSVGRIDSEKNPLLLPEILRLLVDEDPRWRLTVCGEGPLEAALAARFGELGLTGHVEFVGYVPIDGGLLDLYRRSHAFLHVSWTEGVPQVLFEAFAAGTPVVATAVGGVERAAGDAAVVVRPGDADAAAGALRRIAADPALRERLVQAGAERVAHSTLSAEAPRVAEFLDRGDR